MFRRLALGAIFAFVLPFSVAFGDVFINEMRVDQSGSDTDEYVEFYSNTGMSLDGISFVVLQDNGIIDEAIDLTGFSIGAGDVFLISETDPLPTFGASGDLITNLNLENGENAQYLLVEGLTGSEGDDLDGDDDGVFDASLPWTTLLDGIALLDDDPTILDGGSEDIDYSSALGIGTIGPNGAFIPAHVYASVDGGPIDSIGTFDELDPLAADTPGQLNAIPEPGSMVVLGAMSLVLFTRRKR